MKGQETTVVRIDYLHCVQTCSRFEKRHRHVPVHLSSGFRDVVIGDVVRVED